MEEKSFKAKAKILENLFLAICKPSPIFESYARAYLCEVPFSCCLHTIIGLTCKYWTLL